MEREGLKVVFVDTNVIIEAHRTGCWEALVGSYDVHTVETVAEGHSADPWTVQDTSPSMRKPSMPR